MQVPADLTRSLGNHRWTGPEAVTPEQRGTIEVISATFGENKRRVDVTEFVKKFSEDTEKQIRVTAASFRLPACGYVRKHLVIRYKIDGIERTVVLNNGQLVNIRSVLLTGKTQE